MAVPTPPEPPTVGAPTPLPSAAPTVTTANPSEKRISEVLITEDFIDKDLMQDVLPALADKAGIPIIPDETVKGSVTCTLKEVPLDKALDIILAGTRYAVKKTAYYYLISSRDDKATRSPDAGKTPTSNLPLLGMPAEVVGPAPAAAEPKPKPGRDIKIRKSKDDKYIATTEMHFISKVKPGSPFVIRNSLGNIILRPSKDSTCNVKAVIRAEAKTAVEAQEMVEQVSMKLDSSDERYYLKPIKPDDDQWSNLNVDLTIAVPLGVRPDIKTKLGNVQLFGLKGPIKALTDLGSVKAVNTTGDLELLSKMGDIVFAASKDLSAKLRAETQMGSIASDLPLNIEKIDMFKRKAEGTFGSGRDTIRLTTNMGSIRISKQSQNTSPSDPKPLNVSEKNNQNNADKPTIE
jgi:hypothetical protein